MCVCVLIFVTKQGPQAAEHLVGTERFGGTGNCPSCEVRWHIPADREGSMQMTVLIVASLMGGLRRERHSKTGVKINQPINHNQEPRGHVGGGEMSPTGDEVPCQTSLR